MVQGYTVYSVQCDNMSTLLTSFRFGSAWILTDLWIRVGFNARPDPAFYLNADPDPDPYPGEPNQFGSGSGQTLKSLIVEF
jgi:hypothetical protein